MTIASQLLQRQVQITVAGVQVVHVMRVVHVVLRVSHVHTVEEDVRAGATQRFSLANRFPGDGDLRGTSVLNDGGATHPHTHL